MKSLKQFFEEGLTKEEFQDYYVVIKNNFKEWLKQFTCKIPCENCFVSIACPYPRMVEDLEK